MFHIIITKVTYHFLAKKVKPLKSSHCLRASLDILEHNMGLTTHILGFHGNHIQNRPICREEGVERDP